MGATLLKVVEPPHSLKERRFLGKLLDRVRNVCTNTKSVLNAAVQVHLIRRADVEQQGLELGPQGRWQKTVLVCGKVNKVMSASIIA